MNHVPAQLVTLHQLCVPKSYVGVVYYVRIMYRKGYIPQTYEYVLFSAVAPMSIFFTKLSDNLDVCTVAHPASASAYRDSCFDADTIGTTGLYAKATPYTPLCVNAMTGT